MYVGVSVETLSIDVVSVETLTMCGSVGRDTQYRGGVGRDINKLSRPQGKGWIRSGNNRRGLLSNPMTARWNK